MACECRMISENGESPIQLDEIKRIENRSILNGAQRINKVLQFDVDSFIKDHPNGAEECLILRCEWICKSKEFKAGHCDNDVCVCH